jgi:hypothetical protein
MLPACIWEVTGLGLDRAPAIPAVVFRDFPRCLYAIVGIKQLEIGLFRFIPNYFLFVVYGTTILSSHSTVTCAVVTATLNNVDIYARVPIDPNGAMFLHVCTKRP